MGAAVFCTFLRCRRGPGRGSGLRRPRSRRRARRASSSIQSWRFTSPMSRTPRRVRQGTRRQAVAGPAGRPTSRRRRASSPIAGTPARSRGASRRCSAIPCCSSRSGRTPSRRARVEHPGQLAAAVGVDQEGPVVSRRSPPAGAAAWTPSRAACRPPARRRSRGARRSASTPVSRPATGPPRGGSSPHEGHRPGGRHAVRSDDDDLVGVEEGVDRRLQQRPPAELDARLVDRRPSAPPCRRRGPRRRSRRR